MNEKEIIDKYLGIPYKHQGRTLEGLDCYGLIIRIYDDLGFKIWDIEEDYDENWSFKGRDYFIKNYYKEWEQIERPNMFDVVLFHSSKGVANHAGVVLSNDRFIHTCRAGTIISRIYEKKLQERLAGFFHLKARDKYYD